MTHHVYRWHNNADPRLRDSRDTIEGHQIRVRDMCHSLAAHLSHDLYNSDLLHAARHHDEAEKVLGDMPGPAKEQFPALAAAYAIAERQILAEMGYSWRLSNYEAEMLDLCDKLDAWQWARDLGVTGVEWDEAEIKLRRRAHALDVALAGDKKDKDKAGRVQAWLEGQLTRSEVAA